MEQGFETEVLTRLTKIETKLDDSDEAYNLSKENEKEINEINEKLKWITRTVAAAVITGIIGIGIALLKSGMGVN